MRPFPARLRAAVLAVLAGGALAGCYKHVVRVEGYGDQDIDVYEPNLPDKPGPVEQLESAVWGDEQVQQKSSRRKSRAPGSQ